MLYRKWRPRTFAEVVGQGHVVQTLRNALASGRLAHAYLFAGPRGTGKTTCARLLAKGVNCLGTGEDPPCGECTICRAVDEGRLLDLIEIDAASNTGVDDVRELQERAGFRPAQAKYKVYIIDEVHMLSGAAFNALLKTLEEPPPHTVFVLATTEPHKLPATVVSRCQRFAFRPIAESDIVAHLAHVAEVEGADRQHPIEPEPEALSLIARHATGALRDGLSLLEQVAAGGPVTVERVREVLGLVPAEGTLAVLEAVAAGDVGGMLSALSALLDGGADARVVRRQLVDQLRSALVAAVGAKVPALSPSASSGQGVPKGSGLSSGLEALAGAGVEKLLRWLSTLVEVKPHGADHRTGLELALVHLSCGVTARQAVIGPHAPVAMDLAAVSPEEVQGQTAPRSSPHGTRQSTDPSSTEPQGEHSTGREAKVDQQIIQEGTDSGTAIPEPSPPPAIPRQLDALQAHWEEVLARLGRTGHAQIQALLRSCTPVAVDDRKVVVAARYGFHRARLEEDEARQAVEQALARLLGEPVELQVVLADEADGLAPSQTAGGQDDTNLPSGLPPELADDPLVRVAVQELGAVVRVLESV
jgi:DNA polymerase-3 subunit gamma/tau